MQVRTSSPKSPRVSQPSQPTTLAGKIQEFFSEVEKIDRLTDKTARLDQALDVFTKYFEVGSAWQIPALAPLHKDVMKVCPVISKLCLNSLKSAYFFY